MDEEKIAGFEEYYGRTLKPEYRGEEGSAKNGKVIITRPDHYESGNIHINMYVRFDSDYKLIDVRGGKCYSRVTGMWNRSGPAKDRAWSKKDIAYLRKFIKKITM